MTVTEKQLAEANKLDASRGGFARAKKLSKERRSEIARMGALATNQKRHGAN
jgi:hypothetical protein